MITTLVMIGLLGVSPEFELQSLSGRAIKGTLLQINEDRVLLETTKGPVSVGTKNVLGLHSARRVADSADRPAISIELVDGSRLFAEQFLLRDQDARAVLPSGRGINIPRSAIDAVQLIELPETLADQWRQVRADAAAADVIVIRKDQAIDYLEGVLGDVDEGTVEFTLDDEEFQVDRAKVAGLIFYHPTGQPLPDPLGVVRDVHGGQIYVSGLELDADLVNCTTPTGLELARRLEEIVEFDFSRGKIVYLSDLESAVSDWQPLFGDATQSPSLAEFYRPRKDRGLRDPVLRLAGQAYRKGLALAARTQLEYDLPPGFGRFTALVGIDAASSSPGGSLRLVIGDGREQRFAATIRAGDPPVSVNVPLGERNRLTILVDFDDQPSAAEQLSLCEARIVK